MANIGVRSQYIYQTATVTNAKSFKIRITVDSVLRYELIKNTETEEVSMDIAPLIREFFNHTFNGTYPTAIGGYQLSVTLTWTAYNDYNAGGSFLTVGSGTHKAYDAYSYFSEGVSYSFSNNQILVSADLYVPENTSGYVYVVGTTGVLSRQSFTSTAESFTYGGNTIAINRMPCSRYDATSLVFLNKYGVLETVWFRAKQIDSLSTSNEKFKSIIPDTYHHQIRQFNKQGKLRYTLNTGYVKEDFNETIQQLMLSEKVWFVDSNGTHPVNLVSSNQTYKTSLNDKLINYTIDIEAANDLISNYS